MASQPKPVSLANTYSFPRGDLGRKIIITGIVMVLSARKEVISPGSPLYDYVLYRSPNAFKAADWIQKGLFYFLFGAHSIETPIFALKKLAPHGISVLSVAWWQWIATVFAGGVFCFAHFDKLVKAKTA